MQIKTGCYHPACSEWELSKSKRIKAAEMLEFNDLLRTKPLEWLVQYSVEHERFSAYCGCVDASVFVRELQIKSMIKAKQ